MKTRRSIICSWNEIQEAGISPQAVRFPDVQNRSKMVIVPESSGCYDIETECTAAVLETPDGANSHKNCTINRKDNALKIVNEIKTPDGVNDSDVIEVTPDVKLSKKRGVISILESDYSYMNTLKASNGKNAQVPALSDNAKSSGKNFERSIMDRNIRKSLVDKILPFDLNDENSVNKKLSLLMSHNERRKSSVGSHNGSKRNVSLTSDTSNGRAQSYDISARYKRRSSRLSRLDNTIIFNNNNDLDLTDTNSGSDILLRDSLTEAFHTLSTDSNDEVFEPNGHSCGAEKRLARTDAASSAATSSHQDNATNNNLMRKPVHTEDSSLIFNYGNSSPISSYNKMIEVELSPLNRHIFQSQDSVLPTQSASLLILQGVVAYVDVRSGAENRSAPVKDALCSLGADISEKFTMKVSHVIFRDGSKSTYDRSIKRGVHLVSPLWVDACRVKLVRVCESLFPISPEYVEKYCQGISVRPRKLKSMQPREFEEDALRVAARLKKRRHIAGGSSTSESSTQSSRPEPPRSPRVNVNSPLFGIDHLLTPNRETSIPRSACSEESDKEDDFDTPLATRLYKRIMTRHREERPHEDDVSFSDHGNLPLSPLVTVVNLQSHDDSSSLALELRSASETDFESSLTDKYANRDRRSKRIARQRLTLSAGSTAEDLDNMEPMASKKAERVSKLVKHDDISGENQLNITSPASILKYADNSRKQVRLAVSYGNLMEKHLLQEGIKNIKGKKQHNLKLIHPAEDELSSSTFSLCSQPSSSRKRRLHTITCDIPSQDLIVPQTPESPHKHQNCPYDNLHKQDMQTQRKVMKNILKQKDPANLEVVPLPRKVKRSSSEVGENRSSHTLFQGDSAYTEPSRTPHMRNYLIPKERGSLEEFQSSGSHHRRRSCNVSKVYLKSQRSICLTSVHSCDIEGIYAVIKSLGGFRITHEVDQSTTHVVCGSERRTLNVLYGIARGCWILDVSWLYESVEHLKWAPEEPFELFNFCPGAKICRLEKETSGVLVKPCLFNGLGRIFVLDNCLLKPVVLKNLLRECGANLCSTLRSADLAIGSEHLQASDVFQVSEKWVFDCIQYWKIREFRDYCIS